MSTVSKDTYKHLEEYADSDFYEVESPHPNWHIALWHLLTAAEDQLRMLFSRMVPIDPVDIDANVDEMKYALRHCLSSFFLKALEQTSVPLPRNTIPECYIKATDLIKAGRDYNKLHRMFSSLHSQKSLLENNNEDYTVKYVYNLDPRYTALEVLKHSKPPEPDITTFAYLWLINYPDVPFVLHEIVKSTSRKETYRIHYKYNANRAVRLANELPQRERLIPDVFEFPWGNELDTQALINSLHVRCLYHILAVHLGAVQKNIQGGGDSSLLLVLPKKMLIRELEYLANIGRDKIKVFIDHLTFGNYTKTPDPALQPLFRTHSGKVMLPCLHTITCNTQRSLLSLFARVSPKKFDRQSSCFEKTMISKTVEVFKEKYLVTSNKHFTIGDKTEEIDILVADIETMSLLVIELRWMIQPGDPREVDNKINDSHKKVLQVKRKQDFVKQDVSSIVKIAFPEFHDQQSKSQWKVNAMVVLDGFAGHPSGIKKIPITTIDILFHGVRKLKTLSALYHWLESLVWLPQEGTHFELVTDVHTIRSEKIKRPGVTINSTPSQYCQYIENILNE